MRAVVVGGGVGGLAAAVALGRRGWEVEVLEQADRFAEVGAGLSVWPNAVRALEALGLGPAIRQHALRQASAGIRDARGGWLSRTNPAEIESRYGPVVMVHRAALLEVLRGAAPDGSLRTGVEVHAARPDGTVSHSDGESAADLVVGADGIGSVVRRSVWPQTPVPEYAGYTAWRMVTPPVPVYGSSESWGHGERFGYAPLHDGRVYCFATANAAEGAADGGLAGLRRRFGRWHEPIPALLHAAEEDDVLHNDIYELPPLRSYVSGRVALLGDAAHAMTPNLGQGACQALEDAVVLAGVLDRRGSGLDAYDQARRRRTRMIARRSRRIGAVAQWSSPFATGMRDTVMRHLPPSSALRSLAPVLDWTA
jgi:2-polyprenyl-6-methoxyphenol hydroxylase-like FAD-dependent oxidoreductase